MLRDERALVGARSDVNVYKYLFYFTIGLFAFGSVLVRDVLSFNDLFF